MSLRYLARTFDVARAAARFLDLHQDARRRARVRSRYRRVQCIPRACAHSLWRTCTRALTRGRDLRSPSSNPTKGRRPPARIRRVASLLRSLRTIVSALDLRSRLPPHQIRTAAERKRAPCRSALAAAFRWHSLRSTRLRLSPLKPSMNATIVGYYSRSLAEINAAILALATFFAHSQNLLVAE